MDDELLPIGRFARLAGLSVGGDRAASDEWLARGIAELSAITDAEDRQILEQDLATLP